MRQKLEEVKKEKRIQKALSGKTLAEELSNDNSNVESASSWIEKMKKFDDINQENRARSQTRKCPNLSYPTHKKRKKKKESESPVIY